MVLLSRQNALRRVSENNNGGGVAKPTETLSSFGPCQSVKSLYWKIPDGDKYLTSIALQHDGDSFAIASGGKTNNLFIYQLEEGNTVLTHKQTITLAHITSLDWMPGGGVVVSGQRDGMLHLVKLGNPSMNEPAEILKRFNHKRHIDNNYNSQRILKCQVLNSWKSIPKSSIATLSSERLFIWDHSRSDIPMVKLSIPNIKTFDMNLKMDGIGCCIVSNKNIPNIIDIRLRDAIRQDDDDSILFNQSTSIKNNILWSSTNDNLIASTRDNEMCIWDARSISNGIPLSTLTSNGDIINTITWSGKRLYSASADATIRVWDDINGGNVVETIKDNNNNNNKWLSESAQRAYNRRRQCCYSMQSHSTVNNDMGKTLLRQSRDIVSIKSFKHDGGFVTISESGDFALHCSTGDDVVQHVPNYSVPFRTSCLPKDKNPFTIHNETTRVLSKDMKIHHHHHHRKSKSFSSRHNSISSSISSSISCHKHSRTLSLNNKLQPLQSIMV